MSKLPYLLLNPLRLVLYGPEDVRGLVMPSDRKHQSASNTHGHDVKHRTPHVWGVVQR